MSKCAEKYDGPSWASRFETRVGENFDKVMDAIDLGNIQIAVTKAGELGQGKYAKEIQACRCSYGHLNNLTSWDVTMGEVSYL